MRVISKAEALAAGLSRYFTGKPCKRGHTVERLISGNCVECARAASAKHYAQNKDEESAAARARYLKNAETAKARSRMWYRENTEEAQARNKAWKVRNAEKMRAYFQNYSEKFSAKKVKAAAAWAALNPERAKASACRRAHARRARLKEHLSPDIVTRLQLAQGGRCACPCRRLLVTGFQIDHILAVSRGGRNIDANVQLLTPACNRKKGIKDNETFMKQQAAAWRKRANT